MKKWSKIILVITLVAIALSAFVACKVREEDLSLTFVSNDEKYATTIGIEEAKDIFASQPTRDGYVFKGWYLDKGTWTQEVDMSNLEEISKDNKTISVYAYWVEIVNKITVAFCDYHGAILLERDYERSDDQLAKDIARLRPSKRPDDEKYAYTFDKWNCNTDDLTQGYFTATPIYSTQLRSFKFNYFVDGELIYTDSVKYGESANMDLVATPNKQSTDKCDYVFDGWEGNFDDITQDTDVHAKFKETPKKFDVTFKFGDNKSKTVKVEYGKTATAPSASEVLKPSTPQYSYTFVGWDNSLENIKQNTVINAKYAEQVRMYDVKFWVDSTCVKYLNLPYGASAEQPAQPIKNLNDGFTYEFLGWDVAFDNITTNLDVYARFRQISHTYTVEFVNWEGSLLDTQQVSSGQKAEYGGENPTRQSNDKFDYVFDGWTDEDKLGAVTRDITVVAKFKSKIKTFTVTFKYGDNKKTVWPGIEYGANLTNSELVPTATEVAKASTAQYEYEFIGWDVAFGSITQDMEINARYIQSERIYEVKFFVDDTCIKAVNVVYGSSVEAPTQPVKVENDGFTYEFSHWDNEFDNIVEDTVVNAVFNKIANTYTIQYVNWDGTLLYTDSVESAGKSEYVGETPTRESNDKYTYEFIGWSNEEDLKNITSSFSTQAQYKEVIRTYSVTFNYGHGLTKTLTDIPYGTDLSTHEEYSTQIPTDTDKTSTKQYDFTFIDWDKYFGYVSRDMEVNAIYKETLRRYIVKFISNGIAVLTQEVEYGKCPTLPTGNNVKNHTVKWAFAFLGWQVIDVDTTTEAGENDLDPDDGTDYRDTVENAEGYEVLDPANTIVEGEITYTAMYSRTIQKYTVRFFNEENDENVLKEITVPWGTNVLTSEIEDYQAPTAFKESVPKWEYTFESWSRDLTKVEANINTYATYIATIRKYWVTYMNGDVEVDKYHVEYDSVSPIPDVIPTKVSTLQYDFEFKEWDRAADRLVEGDITINAVYNDKVRSYVVTLFNLATRALVSTGEFAYGTKITTTIDYNGYDFDHWYRDPNCDTVFDQENETVDGPMMLFGNIVMKGLKFNDANEIVGYEGVADSQINLILPMAANGKKVNTIKEKGLSTDSVTSNSIGSIYIPSTITKVEAYAFSGLVLTDTGGLYIQAPKKWYGTPSGWNQYWNRNSLTSWHEGDRPVTYGVDGVYSVGDFQYMLFEDGYAYVDRFINNTAPNAYIPAEFTYKLPSFTSTEWVDSGKTEEKRDIYEVVYTEKNYNVTQIAVSAFENCTNLSSIYIPKTIEKVGKYAFSGVTADVYIQMERPKVGLIETDTPSGWNNDWNKNRDASLTDKGTGERTLYWGVIGFDVVGDFNYIFKSDGTAIVAEYLGNKATKTNLEVPGTVTYKEVEYRVEVLADELLSGMNILNTVTLGENIKKIGKKVFANNIVLSTVNLPSTLEEIGDQAFLMNMALKQIYIPTKVSKIGSLAFIGIDNLTLYLGKDKKPLSGYAIGWDTKIGVSDLGDLDLSNIMGSIGTLLGKFTQTHDKVWGVAGLPQTYKETPSLSALPAEYTYLFYNDGHAELIGSSIAAGSMNTSYNMPSSINFNGNDYAVTKIRASAFKGNTRIKELIIPTSVTTIEAYAFEGCSSLTIKTAHADKPSGWDSNFNPDGRSVEWGYGVSAASETTEEVA